MNPNWKDVLFVARLIPLGTFAVARCTPSVYVTDGFSGCPQWERMFEGTSWSDLRKGTKIVIVKMSRRRWCNDTWFMKDNEWWRMMHALWHDVYILCMLHVHVDIKSRGHRHIVFPPYLSYSGGTWPVGVYLRSAWEGLSDLGRFAWNVSTLKIGERDLRDEKGPASWCTELLKRDWFFWGECKKHVSIWSWYMIGVILEL